jgi:hypothetical protein
VEYYWLDSLGSPYWQTKFLDKTNHYASIRLLRLLLFGSLNSSVTDILSMQGIQLNNSDSFSGSLASFSALLACASTLNRENTKNFQPDISRTEFTTSRLFPHDAFHYYSPISFVVSQADLFQVRAISGFCRAVDENCALRGYCTASSGNFLPTFRNNLSVTFRGQESQKNLDP